MYQSQLFTKTKKHVSCEAELFSHKLLLKADFIDQLTSGIFSFLPLGFLVLKKIENIIREEIKAIGGQEVILPAIQPKSLWEETNRWQTIDPPLFKFFDRHKKELALGSTHEEVIFDLVRKRVFSYRDLPVSLFQIQTKFRNEMRCQGGLLRVREFLMKDLYSFHSTEEDLKKYYQEVIFAYHKIYKRCEVNVIKVEASGGTIGGKTTHEFMVLADCGEDKILVCKNCDFAANTEVYSLKQKCPKCGKNLVLKNGIEVGHIFQLGTEYSRKMNVKFLDKNGKEQLIWAGCYGIGIGRLMATIVEVNHDNFGIIWPKEVSPFDVHLISLQSQDKNVKNEADNIYQNLQDKKINVLYDDRNVGPGEKLKDADLIGISRRIIVSRRTLEKKMVEYKERKWKIGKLIKKEEVENFLKSQL